MSFIRFKKQSVDFSTSEEKADGLFSLIGFKDKSSFSSVESVSSPAVSLSASSILQSTSSGSKKIPKWVTPTRMEGLAAEFKIKNEYIQEHQDNYREFLDFIQNHSMWFSLLKATRNPNQSAEEAAVFKEEVKSQGKELFGPNVDTESSPFYVKYTGAQPRPAVNLSKRMLTAFFSDTSNLKEVELLYLQKLNFLEDETKTKARRKNILAITKNKFFELNMMFKKLKDNIKNFQVSKAFEKADDAVKNAMGVVGDDLDEYPELKAFREYLILYQQKLCKVDLSKATIQTLVELAYEIYKHCNNYLAKINLLISKLNRKKMKSDLPAPLCLSFAIFDSSKGMGAWIMISNPEKYNKLFARLYGFISKYEDHIELSLLNGASEDSQTHLQLVLRELGYSHPALPYRSCIEKSLASLAVKKTFEDPRFQLIDVINFGFYPHPVESKSKLTMFEQTQGVAITVNGTERWLPEIPCCEHCQKNKFAFLAILGAAREFREFKLRKDLSVLKDIQKQVKEALRVGLDADDVEESDECELTKSISLVTSPPEKSVACRSRTEAQKIKRPRNLFEEGYFGSKVESVSADNNTDHLSKTISQG